jgi:hypothetical protein
MNGGNRGDSPVRQACVTRVGSADRVVISSSHLGELDSGGASPRARDLHQEILSLRPLDAALCLRIGKGLLRLQETGCLDALGHAGFGDMARERLGLSPSQGRDLARMARMLPELPTLGRAYRSGALCKSQVLELIKVATPETERGWVALSVGRDFRKVKEMVGAYREGGEEEGLERVGMEVSPATKAAFRWGSQARSAVLATGACEPEPEGRRACKPRGLVQVEAGGRGEGAGGPPGHPARST